MKHEKGTILISSLIFLVLLSLAFSSVESSLYSSMKVSNKNVEIDEVHSFQNTLLLSLKTNKWLSNGNHSNDLLCQEFDCLNNQKTNINISTFNCNEEVYKECFSAIIETNYNGLIITKEKNIKIKI